MLSVRELIPRSRPLSRWPMDLGIGIISKQPFTSIVEAYLSTRVPIKNPEESKYLTFAELVSSIRQAHDLFSAQASKAVNIGLTLRNWFIGMYITEYELHGADRAGYGENLFK